MNLSAIGKIIREYPLLLVCGVLVILFGVLVIIRGPKVNEQEKQLEELETEWGRMQTNQERSRELEEHVALLEEQLDKLEGRLLDPEEVAQNHEFFYRLEEGTGVSLRDFQQAGPTSGEELEMEGTGMKHFRVLRYALTATGPFARILHFLEALEGSGPVVRIEGMQLRRAEEATSAEMTTVQFNCYVLATGEES